MCLSELLGLATFSARPIKVLNALRIHGSATSSLEQSKGGEITQLLALREMGLVAEKNENLAWAKAEIDTKDCREMALRA